MPYIEKPNRKYLDPVINELANHIKELAEGDFTACAGMLNYCFTRVTMQCMGHIRYWKIALVKGIFSTLGAEFERRIVIPYEADKRVQHGDVKEYVGPHVGGS